MRPSRSDMGKRHTKFPSKFLPFHFGTFWCCHCHSKQVVWAKKPLVFFYSVFFQNVQKDFVGKKIKFKWGKLILPHCIRFIQTARATGITTHVHVQKCSLNNCLPVCLKLRQTIVHTTASKSHKIKGLNPKSLPQTRRQQRTIQWHYSSFLFATVFTYCSRAAFEILRLNCSPYSKTWPGHALLV